MLLSTLVISLALGSSSPAVQAFPAPVPAPVPEPGIKQANFKFPISIPGHPQPSSVFPGDDDDPLPFNVSVLSPRDVRAWTAPAYYASAAYCPSPFIKSWKCGPACDNLPRPLEVAVGGDGESNPRYYVAELPDKTMLIAISGTNASSSDSIHIDLDFLLVPTDQRDFPGGNEAGVLVHKGFHEAFGRMRGEIGGVVLAGVGRGVKEVLVVGHSMGGALAQLVGTYLQVLIGWDAKVKVRGFASPRSGNDRWADYVDAVLGPNNQFMVNFADHVPHLPPRLWGYWHSAGEVWSLPDPERYWLCGGQENPACSLSLETPEHEIELVRSFVDLLGVPEHLGPYAGVTISDFTCPI